MKLWRTKCFNAHCNRQSIVRREMRMPNEHSHSQELLLFMCALSLANQMKLLANAKRDKNAKNGELSVKFIAFLLLANQLSCSQLSRDTKMPKVQNWANFILKSFSLKWLYSFYSDVLLVLVAILTRCL